MTLFLKLTGFSQLDKPLLIAPAKDLVQRLAKLGTEPAQYAAEMDEPTYKVSTHFSDVLPEGYLSIVVGAPANGEMGIVMLIILCSRLPFTTGPITRQIPYIANTMKRGTS